MSERRLRPYPAYKNSGVEWLGEIPAAYLAQYRLRVEPEEDLLVLARWVAETPVIAGSVRWPRDVVRQLLIGPNDEPTG
jgi:hypothetical protein